MEYRDRPKAGSIGGRIAATVILVTLIIFSFSCRNIVSSPGFFLNLNALTSLDRKQDTALELTAAATGASLAVSFIPGDAGTPIAEELADIASKLSIALGAVLLEKYLLTVFQYLTFGWLLPVSALLLIIYLWRRKELIRQIALKVFFLGLVLSLTIPVSEHLSLLVQQTYQASINETIASANTAVDQLSEELSDDNADAASEETPENAGTSGTETDTSTEAEKKGVLENIGSSIAGAASSAADTVSGIADSAVGLVTGSVSAFSDTVEQFRTVLNHFVEAFAMMMILCCGLPVVTILFMLYIAGKIMGSNMNVRKLSHTVEQAAPNVNRRRTQREERSLEERFPRDHF